MKWKILDKQNRKILNEEELALKMYNAGEHIIYCDLEGIAVLGDDYYLIDECGNAVWIDPDKYKVSAGGDMMEFDKEVQCDDCANNGRMFSMLGFGYKDGKLYAKCRVCGKVKQIK